MIPARYKLFGFISIVFSLCIAAFVIAILVRKNDSEVPGQGGWTEVGLDTINVNTTSVADFLTALATARTAKIELFPGKGEYLMMETYDRALIERLIRGENEWRPLGEIDDPRLPTIGNSVRFVALGQYQPGVKGRMLQHDTIFHVKLTAGLKMRILETIGTEWAR